MAKRIYTPRPVSPEIARENAIKEAKAVLMYAQRDLRDAEAMIAAIKSGKADYTLSLEAAERALETAKADLQRAEAAWTALNP